MEGYQMRGMTRKKVHVHEHHIKRELMGNGFHAYRPIKLVTMARMVPAAEAPKIIETADEILTALAGYWIVYAAGEVVQKALDEYKPRPIHRNIFAELYRPWDEPLAKLKATEVHLHQLGCQFYYKIASIWAKQLPADTLIHTTANAEPMMVPAGAWLCRDIAGEPWSVTDRWFRAQYIVGA